MFKLELWLRSSCTLEMADKLRKKMLDALADDDGSKPNNRVNKMPEFVYSKRSIK